MFVRLIQDSLVVAQLFVGMLLAQGTYSSRRAGGSSVFVLQVTVRCCIKAAAADTAGPGGWWWLGRW